MKLCILCSKDIGVGEFVSLRQKGTDSINKASEECGNDLEANQALLYKNCVDFSIKMLKVLSFVRKVKKRLSQNKCVCIVQTVHLILGQIAFSAIKQQNQNNFMTKVR